MIVYTELKIIYLEDLPIELPVITKKDIIYWVDLRYKFSDVIEIIEVEGNITLYAVGRKTLIRFCFT